MSEEKKEETLEQEKKEVLDQEKELDASELDEVAGGSWCSCCFGGGGEWNDGGARCACVGAGGGCYD